MILHQIPWRRTACSELGLRQTSISVLNIWGGLSTFYYCSFLCHKELTCNDRIIWGFKVVYRIYGQTAQIPWFGQMVSEIHNWSILPRIAFTIFTNHGSIYRKTTAKAWKWYQTGFEEMEHEFHPEKQVKQDYLFQMFRYSGKFFAGATQEVVFHLLPNRIIRKIFVNGKQSKWHDIALLPTDHYTVSSVMQLR